MEKKGEKKNQIPTALLDSPWKGVLLQKSEGLKKRGNGLSNRETKKAERKKPPQKKEIIAHAQYVDAQKSRGYLPRIFGF